MKLIKGGVDVDVSGITDVWDEAKFLLQCPNTGTVYVLQKRRSSSRECYYITPQNISSGQVNKRRAIFQYSSGGNRRVHFNDSQIDLAIRSGNFSIKEV